mmetsp:Transcript_2767/g.9326  ORF Transcript_2767/g.9326 Transcript_2767/m.9326 type:complete len:324 (-) Transcript_2767:63-1034(-)
MVLRRHVDVAAPPRDEGALCPSSSGRHCLGGDPLGLPEERGHPGGGQHLPQPQALVAMLAFGAPGAGGAGALQGPGKVQQPLGPPRGARGSARQRQTGAFRGLPAGPDPPRARARGAPGAVALALARAEPGRRPACGRGPEAAPWRRRARNLRHLLIAPLRGAVRRVDAPPRRPQLRPLLPPRVHAPHGNVWCLGPVAAGVPAVPAAVLGLDARARPREPARRLVLDRGRGRGPPPVRSRDDGGLRRGAARRERPPPRAPMPRHCAPVPRPHRGGGPRLGGLRGSGGGAAGLAGGGARGRARRGQLFGARRVLAGRPCMTPEL